ncbi:MAG: hypothetical protein PHC66_00740 [Candidatus Nanoarchaeia archaeon]|nr:hypothetical protein [Candidatus Nanoarchaeia archaeon]MDD5239529.1 hypothetical protein [Candidatus Nanoarchaeia archaeon]
MENEQKKAENKKGLAEQIKGILLEDGRKAVRMNLESKSVTIQPLHKRAKLELREDGSYSIYGTATPGFEKIAYGLMEMAGLTYTETQRANGEIDGHYTRKTG